MDYKNKYLKYKNKYLQLRNQFGSSNNLPINRLNGWLWFLYLCFFIWKQL